MGQLFGEFLQTVFPRPPAPRFGERNTAADENNERRFTYVYLIMALLSRGSVVKDQILLDQNKWIQFLQVIEKHYNDDEKHYLCEAALEDLLNHVDSTQPRVGNLIETFERLCNARLLSGDSNQISPGEWREGFRKVRKLVLTPTRKIFMVPETIMGNRALSGVDHDGTRVIRTTFRDDNGQPMRVTFLRKLLKSSVMKWLTDGFRILEREFGFLGCSNSQMRDGGCYFMERYSLNQLRVYMNKNNGNPPPVTFKPKIIEYREKLGKFEELESIPKVLARMGQCFTQARVCDGVNIGLNDYVMIPDVLGGRNKAGQSYTFTDGIGTISMALAKRIAQSQGFSHRFVPSAFQFRFRGFKGMLVVDPGMDEMSEHFVKLYRRGALHNQIEMSGDEAIDLVPWVKQCVFRDSQLKFKDPTSKKSEWAIELVKYSTPSPLTLNRPFINILDQVSAFQSFECHKRVVRRIEELLDLQTADFSKCIFNEESCRAKLAEMPRRIHFASLERKYGFQLSTEPFFRAMVKSAIDVAMIRLLSKIQIQVPTNLARTMYGVIDTSGQLQYGQVFVQYTTNINVKHPSVMAHSEILKGDVMITKFPAVVEGDVRMFTAVDIPELRHLVNVVVFPQSGPRPHPDEMAGSDLDGDEYAVIWDKELFLERNEAAFEYCSEKPAKAFEKEEMDAKMHEFVAEYMELDSVGMISINHLYQSDQFGLVSPVCQALATKNSQALDYVKSGVPPSRLTTRWEHNHRTQRREPPERSERQPDFALCQNRASFTPTYTSSRLLGTLSRELRSVKDVIVTSAERQIEVVPDAMIDWDGWQDYQQPAEQTMTRYNSQIRWLMDSFGVKTEAELFSGSFRELRCRISDKEGDDMSLYSTDMLIERKMTQIFQKFREEFFEEFRVSGTEPSEKAFMKLTVAVNDWESDELQDDVLRRVCHNPNQQMMAKATAYYKVCYEIAANSQDKRLSFAWIAYDILNVVKSKNTLESEIMPEPIDPQMNAICTHRCKYIKENYGDFLQFKNRINTLPSDTDNDKQEELAKKILQNYIEKYPHLEECLFILERWARAARVLHDKYSVTGEVSLEAIRDNMKDTAASRLKWYHLALMVVMCAAKRFGSLGEVDSNNGTAILDMLTLPISPISESEKRPLSDTNLDVLTSAFFRYLSSRDFLRAKSLSFKPVGLSSVFLRGEWLEYHKSAIKSNFNLLLNMRLDELPLESDIGRRGVLREGVPFIVDLPTGVDVDVVLGSLRRKSKCVDIQARLENGSVKYFDRILISSRGSVEANNALRDLVSVPLPRYLHNLSDAMSKDFSHLCYYRIVGTKFLMARKESVPSEEGEVSHPLQRIPSNTLRNRPRRQRARRSTESTENTENVSS